MYPEELQQYLDKADVTYRLLTHRLAVDAQHLAEALGVPGRQVAKTVFVQANDEPLACVLAAPDHLDLQRLAHALGDPDTRLMTETEFAPWCARCEIGAFPPLADVLGMSLIVDASLAQNDVIIFRAGTHEDCVAMSYEDFIQVAKPMLVDRIAVQREKAEAAAQAG